MTRRTLFRDHRRLINHLPTFHSTKVACGQLELDFNLPFVQFNEAYLRSAPEIGEESVLSEARIKRLTSANAFELKSLFKSARMVYLNKENHYCGNMIFKNQIHCIMK